jgi:hypothetical protein
MSSYFGLAPYVFFRKKNISKSTFGPLINKIREIRCQNGSIVRKFYNNGKNITEITYGANHKNAQKIGLLKFRIEKDAYGRKTFISDFKTESGNINRVVKIKEPIKYNITKEDEWEKNFYKYYKYNIMNSLKHSSGKN